MLRTGVVTAALLLAGCGVQQDTSTLIGAVRDGRADLIPLLVKQGADPNQRGGVNGWTALMHGIHKNQKGSLVALLDAGADVNGRGAGGETPLMMAAATATPTL